MDAQTIVSRAKTQLMLRHPFFGAVAMGVPFILDENIPTMATDGRSIRFNPEFVVAQGPELITGVTAHEALHIAFKHMLRRGEYDHQIWNMACDYAINPIVIDAGLKIPEEGLVDKRFYNMSAEAIYSKLLSEGVEPPKRGWDFGGCDPATGEGGDTITQGEAESLSAEIDVQIAQAIAVAQAAGSIPAGVESLIEEMGKPSVDWCDKMRQFVGGDQPDDYTFTRCNRKWIQHGIYMPAVNHFGVGHVAVVADTSGSTLSVLSQFLGELNALSEDMSPESVTVISCDSAVQSVHRYERGDVIEELDAKGGGGTRVTPAFEWIDENLPEVDSVIYLTDLYVHDFPDEPPYPVLWCSVGKQKAPWGEVVKVTP